MYIRLSKDFKKYFKKRISPNTSLEKHYKEKVSLFIENKRNPLLKDHKLIGKLKGYRAFSITGDIRIIYVEESKNTIMFTDIGTHNQVYS